MLARTFLTAKELRCSEIERQAAIEVLDLLERGELQQLPVQAFAMRIEGGRVFAQKSLPANAFNITFWAHCMGGWMEHMKGRQLSLQCIQRWRDLFEPEGWDTDDMLFTPERCARALNAKLATGKASWD